MNRYARSVILKFSSKENRADLYAKLSSFFNDPTVARYLNEHLDISMDHFVEVIQQELSVSDPMPGVTVSDQIVCYNNQFIKDRIEFIHAHVLPQAPPKYTVTDLQLTSRREPEYYQMSPNEILKTWLANSGRPVQLREDCNTNPFSLENGVTTGIVFCDQSQFGTSNHVDQYENTRYKIDLNRTVRPHEDSAFGVTTPEADDRLLGRRIFRRAAGVENGIPKYESRLYNRHLERDISESLRSTEKDCIVRGWDMSAIKCRLDHKRKVRDKYSLPCDVQVESRLYFQ